MSKYMDEHRRKENAQILEHDIPPNQQFPILQQSLLFRILLLVRLISTPCPARRGGSIAITHFRLSARTILAQTHSACVHDLTHLRQKFRVVCGLKKRNIRKDTQDLHPLDPRPHQCRPRVPMRLARRKSIRSPSSTL